TEFSGRRPEKPDSSLGKAVPKLAARQTAHRPFPCLSSRWTSRVTTAPPSITLNVIATLPACSLQRVLSASPLLYSAKRSVTKCQNELSPAPRWSVCSLSFQSGRKDRLSSASHEPSTAQTTGDLRGLSVIASASRRTG